jgi:hypothetical protein
MKSIKTQRGRPLENDAPLLIYTQEFKSYDGERHIWRWDKTKNKNGPISVEIFDNRFNISEKLLKELESIEKKYIPKKGDRKPRIIKEDKKRMEQIQHELEEFHYSLYPEDRPVIKTRGRKPKIK